MSSKYKGGYIAVSEGDKYKTFNESFKGVVTDIETKFPKGLGASHPFNFDDIEKLYIKYAIVSEAVNKLTNSVITEFQIKLKNPNAQAIIDSFIHDTDFYTVLSAWVREGFLKGNGFIELDLTDIKIRVMNANNMYVKRNSVGKVLGYAQWSKSFKSFNKNSTDLTTFKPNQIAHITINKIPNDPYGIGIIFPNERIIENLVKNEQDLQTIISRKSGQPYHFKVGQPGTNVPSSVVDAIKSKLQYLTKTTEWVTDGDIDIKTIDFGNIGKNITESQLYFFKQFIAGTGIPEVLFGSGQLNEGIAKVQLESYKQRVKSYQNQIAHIIEEKIIKPLSIAILFILMYLPTFIWMWDRWMAKGSYYGHGILIPFISGFIAWQALKKKKGEEVKTKDNPSNLGLFLIISGLFIHLISAWMRIYFSSGFSMIITLSGLALYFGGKNTFKKLAFPILFLAFMIPLPLVAIANIVFKMKIFAAQISTFFVRKMGIPAIINGSMIHMRKTKDRKSTRLNSSHIPLSRMPSSA